MSTEENNKKEELISEKQDLQDRLRSRSPEKDTLLKFICEYGELDFSEQPFCEGDDAVLAMLSYMDMSGLMEDGPLLLTELCERYLAEERGEQLLTYDAERLARYMARARRYRELKVRISRSSSTETPSSAPFASTSRMAAATRPSGGRTPPSRAGRRTSASPSSTRPTARGSRPNT